MAKRHTAFSVASGPGEARGSCLVVLHDLGWTLLESEPSRITAREDIARLCCRSSPAQVEIFIADAEEGSRIELHAEVPGFGPLATRSLGCLAVLESRITESVARIPASPSAATEV